MCYLNIELLTLDKIFDIIEPSYKVVYIYLNKNHTTFVLLKMMIIILYIMSINKFTTNLD